MYNVYLYVVTLRDGKLRKKKIQWGKKRKKERKEKERKKNTQTRHLSISRSFYTPSKGSFFFVILCA